MEDEDIAIETSIQIQEQCIPFKLFGVFDGHAGSDVSKFVKENIEIYLKEALTYYNENNFTEEGIFHALKRCFILLDTNLPKDIEDQGTTATVALVIEDNIWVANVGDSRTIFVKEGGEIIQASEDAKPTMPGYLKTIKKLGGIVSYQRVNGILAVARAIGDKTIVGGDEDSPCNNTCCVSPKPKITCLPFEELAGGYLVLACDGLYDVASTDEVGKAINDMSSLSYTPQQMSRTLVAEAIQHSSIDNVTVVVVKL